MTLRIVSLLASATEMVAALGLADQLVGVSHECDWPPEAVRGRPVVTRAKLDVTRRSAAIHRDVEALVAQALSVYEIDVTALRALRPTHIITQDQCAVCAVPYDEVVAAARQCLATEAEIVNLHPDRLEDIFADIRRVAVALGVGSQGETLIADLRHAIERVAAPLRQARLRPRVITLEWTDPLMVAGNWVPELVALAGGENGITRVGDHTRVVTWPEIQAYDPDVLIVVPCGFRIAQTLENRADLERLPGWRELRAVRDGRCWIVDGNTYVNRPGPRIVESHNIFAGLLHPTVCGDLIPPEAVLSWPSTIT